MEWMDNIKTREGRMGQAHRNAREQGPTVECWLKKMLVLLSAKVEKSFEQMKGIPQSLPHQTKHKHLPNHDEHCVSHVVASLLQHPK